MAKKIGAIVSLIVIGIVIFMAILMASIDVKYSIECVKPDRIYVTSSTNEHFASQEQIDKIVELINNASKQNALTALFDGELGKKAELVTSKATLGNPSNFFVKYCYNTKQDLMVNGSAFKDADGNVVTFKELIFAVTDVKGEAEFKVYVLLNEGKDYSYYYNLDANFEELFSYLTEIFAE